MDRVEVKPGYEGLAAVLDDALEQAQSGKGKERHASGEVFEDQLICVLGRQVGLGFLLGQAIKKAVESQRLPGKRGIAELHGAINYLAAAALLREQGVGDPGEPAVEEDGPLGETVGTEGASVGGTRVRFILRPQADRKVAVLEVEDASQVSWEALAGAMFSGGVVDRG